MYAKYMQRIEERRAELLNYLSTKENVLLTMFIQHMNVDSIAASFVYC